VGSLYVVFLFCNNHYVYIIIIFYRTTIGYGDLTPTNFYEVCLLIVGELMATFTFSMAFGAVGNIIQELQREFN